MVRDREFDVVLWGATGAVGRRVAYHLANRANQIGHLRWALGGRSQTKLEAVRLKLGPTASDVPIITGDNHDTASLNALAARAKVICSTVGPFAVLGSKLVETCAHSSTHYCDLSAEVHWMRKMIDAHQATAEKTGARLVHACGFDSIPSDIGVFFLQNKAKDRHKKPCSHIKMRITTMRGGFSGGTAASFVNAIEQRPKDPSVQQLLIEPYSLNPEGQRRGPDLPEKMMPVKVAYDEDLKAWTMPFFMSPMNTKIVRRSNALLGYPYGQDFRYEEAILVGSGPVGWLIAAMGAAAAGGFMLSMALSPTRWLLKRYVFPKPGEGPDRQVREQGFYQLILIGKLDSGETMRAHISGTGDPGVESTSRILVESALCLAQETDKIKVGGGFWTPASAMAELLLPRLIDHAGLKFELE